MEAELENLKNKNAQGRMMLKDKNIDRIFRQRIRTDYGY